MSNMIHAQNLIKKFSTARQESTVLKGVSADVARGEFVAIMGRSGAGKSTLLYQLSLLDRQTKGEVILDTQHTSQLTDTERTEFRLKKLGFVFQDYALLPELTAEENVALPLLMQGYALNKAITRSHSSLEAVGLSAKFQSLPSELSGGEQQRVSIARAIVHDPIILFADEPTANLDSDSAQRVLSIFQELHKKGQTILMVTHEKEYGALANRVIRLHDGLVVEGS